uniref:Pyrrolo-quinoline quinone repeat domain-containing protein n=1 Tax=Corethron hystrix TaxID=216773 RepID=A0A7S1G290_9STRA|mmetsp:Transcript_785/g.1587  ORF Transcript_785/g.1587 Transcript_785/m.1587 type:complete len:1076 (+) Transcript_785:3-3230(+)
MMIHAVTLFLRLLRRQIFLFSLPTPSILLPPILLLVLQSVTSMSKRLPVSPVWTFDSSRLSPTPSYSAGTSLLLGRGNDLWATDPTGVAFRFDTSDVGRGHAYSPFDDDDGIIFSGLPAETTSAGTVGGTDVFVYAVHVEGDCAEGDGDGCDGLSWSRIIGLAEYTGKELFSVAVPGTATGVVLGQEYLYVSHNEDDGGGILTIFQYDAKGENGNEGGMVAVRRKNGNRRSFGPVTLGYKSGREVSYWFASEESDTWSSGGVVFMTYPNGDGSIWDVLSLRVGFLNGDFVNGVALLMPGGERTVWSAQNISMYTMDDEEIIWTNNLSRDYPDEPYVQPTLSNSGKTIYISRSKVIYSLDADNGEILWYTHLSGPVTTKLRVSPNDKYIYVITNTGTVSSLDAATGLILWSHTDTSGSRVEAEFCLSEDGSLLYYATVDGLIVALNTGCCQTKEPTMSPTYQWTQVPTGHTTLLSSKPSSLKNITREPTMSPTNRPTLDPSSFPTYRPTSTLLNPPSAAPQDPSAAPKDPSAVPTSAPTKSPSHLPSSPPFPNPTGTPSFVPTNLPSHPPTSFPSFHPVDAPSWSPSSFLLESSIPSQVLPAPLPTESIISTHPSDRPTLPPHGPSPLTTPSQSEENAPFSDFSIKLRVASASSKVNLRELRSLTAEQLGRAYQDIPKSLSNFLRVVVLTKGFVETGGREGRERRKLQGIGSGVIVTFGGSFVFQGSKVEKSSTLDEVVENAFRGSNNIKFHESLQNADDKVLQLTTEVSYISVKVDRPSNVIPKQKNEGTPEYKTFQMATAVAGCLLLVLLGTGLAWKGMVLKNRQKQGGRPKTISKSREASPKTAASTPLQDFKTPSLMSIMIKGGYSSNESSCSSNESSLTGLTEFGSYFRRIRWERGRERARREQMNRGTQESPVHGEVTATDGSVVSSLDEEGLQVSASFDSQEIPVLNRASLMKKNKSLYGSDDTCGTGSHQTPGRSQQKYESDEFEKLWDEKSKSSCRSSHTYKTDEVDNNLDNNSRPKETSTTSLQSEGGKSKSLQEPGKTANLNYSSASSEATISRSIESTVQSTGS